MSKSKDRALIKKGVKLNGPAKVSTRTHHDTPGLQNQAGVPELLAKKVLAPEGKREEGLRGR